MLQITLLSDEHFLAEIVLTSVLNDFIKTCNSGFWFTFISCVHSVNKTCTPYHCQGLISNAWQKYAPIPCATYAVIWEFNTSENNMRVVMNGHQPISLTKSQPIFLPSFSARHQGHLSVRVWSKSAFHTRQSQRHKIDHLLCYMEKIKKTIIPVTKVAAQIGFFIFISTSRSFICETLKKIFPTV